MNWLTYDGTDLRDFGVYISGNGTFNAPERDITSIAVPGRNGDLTIDNGRYKNIKVKYPAFIVEEFADNIGAMREYLSSKVGYYRLEDTYAPDEYRMARVSGGITAKPLDELIAGNFDLSFDCKPQRYLKSGEEWISVNANVSPSASLFNSTRQRALPLIKVTSAVQMPDTVVIIIGAVQITLALPAFETIYVDCEMQEAYLNADMSGNANAYLTLDDDVFPYLDEGNNAITITANYLSAIQIQPRWWRL